MLKYCYAQDRSFTFRNSNFLGVRISIWTIFGLFLEAFLNFSHLCLFPFSFFTSDTLLFFPTSNLPNYYGFELRIIVLITVILQMCILPFGFIGFLILNRRIFLFTTIFTIFQCILFIIFGLVAISYHTVTFTRPLKFLGIQLLLSLPIHLFCSIIFINFTKFAQFYSESMKNNYDFGNFVERSYLALKKQKNQLDRRSRGKGFSKR
uniref:Uncharacterized protein n=1 Tax=Panagrolaimus superbus TaxID=310955 RepID=A0A914Y9A0_9BILA